MRPSSALWTTLLAAAALAGCATTAKKVPQKLTYFVVPCDTPGAIRTGGAVTAPETVGPSAAVAEASASGQRGTPEAPDAGDHDDAPVCIVAAGHPRAYARGPYTPYRYYGGSYPGFSYVGGGHHGHGGHHRHGGHRGH